MEQSVVTGTAHDPSGIRFAIIGLSNMPTNWADVLRSLGGDLTIDALKVEDSGVDHTGTTVATPVRRAASRRPGMPTARMTSSAHRA